MTNHHLPTITPLTHHIPHAPHPSFGNRGMFEQRYQHDQMSNCINVLVCTPYSSVDPFVGDVSCLLCATDGFKDHTDSRFGSINSPSAASYLARYAIQFAVEFVQEAACHFYLLSIHVFLCFA